MTMTIVPATMTEAQKQARLERIEREKDIEAQAAEEAKKNRNFVQIYRASMPEIRWLMLNHSFASTVLFFILEHMDGKNTLACSYELMIDYFGKTRNTIYKAIKILEENGFLGILKIGTSNVYVINAQVAWTSYENQKTGAMAMYSSIEGKMLVSRKENEDYTMDKQSERFKALGSKLKNKRNLKDA